MPNIYNAAFGELGLDYRYFAFEPDHIGEAVAGMRALKFAGASISAPFKQDVIACLDDIDPVAYEIRAVNCVHNLGGFLKGYNSDWIGAVGALREKCQLEGARVAVLGSGGAARAVVFGLARSGASAAVFSRHEEPGRAVAAEMGASYGGAFKDVVNYRPEILVNATSIGSAADEEVPISDSVFASARTVMDIAVRPTRFLGRASSAGSSVIGGVRMLVLQAAFSFEVFTSFPAPVDVMQRAADEAVLA